MSSFSGAPPGVGPAWPAVPADALPAAVDSVRLRTLTLIRWVAIAGQAGGLMVVHFGFGYALPLAPALAVVGASFLLNVIATAVRPTAVRLGGFAAAGFLGFDILQLAALLYLTGGLENPFAILLLAPVAVSATILSVRSTVALCVLSILCISGLAVEHYPLPWGEGGFSVPRIYVLGIWAALAISILFFAIYTWRVAEEARRMSNALAASQLALAREQQLAALGGLAAAAAHELGSPLGTIAVVSREIARDLPADSPIREDIDLLISETARCRDILAELSDRSGEDDEGSPFARLPISALVQASADRHLDERVELYLDAAPAHADDASAPVPEPVFVRRPEIVHGIGNLIQNAVQFAASRVDVRVRWDGTFITVEIADDGPGFPAGLLERLGEPYISMRTDSRGHMGLGIFIARTLLQRSGAALGFENDPRGGARVKVVWRSDSADVIDEGRNV